MFFLSKTIIFVLWYVITNYFSFLIHFLFKIDTALYCGAFFNEKTTSTAGGEMKKIVI